MVHGAPGDAAAATSLEKAVALGATTSHDLYNAACGYALIGRKEDALRLLERAVAAGFRDRRLLENDTDLANIRDTERFRQILAKVAA